jgi:ribosomal protein S18 acetylase RimI-like enzyme
VLLELPDVVGTAELAHACGFEVEKHSFDMARSLLLDAAEFDAWIDSFLMIAADTLDVVGYVLSNADHERGERAGVREVRLSTITTRRGYRRRGVATALIGAVLAEAVVQGYGRATLDVDTDNPSGALRVYERAGFAVVDSATSYVRELL